MNDPVDRNVGQRNELIQSLHESKTELVLALSGGGSLVLSDLLTVPGASHTVIEASVPYSQESLREYIGRVPDQYCSQRTARYMAMKSFHRGIDIIRARLNPAASQSISGDQMRRRGVDVSHASDLYLTSLGRDVAAQHDSFQKKAEEPVPPPDLDDFFHLIGIGCTASLATNRGKKGDYRVHVAAQTLRRTQVFSLQLTKDARDRWEEERLLADLILNVIETVRRETLAMNKSVQEQENDRPDQDQSTSPTPPKKMPDQPGWNTFGQGTSDNFPLQEILPLELKDGEKIQGRQAVGTPPLVDLFFGKIWAVLWKDGEIEHFRFHRELPTTQSRIFNPQAEFMQAIFPGSFNPIHQGHLEMIDIAQQKLGSRVALEISVQNVDKPCLDYIELKTRLEQIREARPGQAVWLTQTPLFEEKSELFQGATFVVGADTLRRFAELRFYHESIHRLHDVLRAIGYNDCRFLVFGRVGPDDRIENMKTLNVPDMLRSLTDEIPETEFRMNISSRDLRRCES